MRLHSIKPLNEGGNIFKTTDGNSITGRINRADIEPTIKWLETITQLPLVDNTLGSVGKKESSGDLDIAVDQNAISKDELITRLNKWVKAQGEDPKNWIKKSGISVHFLTPIRGNKKQGYVQSDFMFGDDIEHMKFGLYSAGDTSKFSGADRNLLMSSVAKSLPGDYKYSWQKGLIERSTGNTITRDPDQIAKILLGSMKYTSKDLDSVESIISAIKNPPDRIAGPNRYELLTALADRLTSTEGKKAAEIRADSEEATRLHKILGESMRLFETDNSNLDTADEQTQLAAVKQDGRIIRFIKNPSEQVQLAAVIENGYAIRSINNPSEQTQLAAVNQYGLAIKYIKNPSEQVQLAAIKQDAYAIAYIKNPTEQVKIAAVKQNGHAIAYIKNPSLSFLNQCKPEIIKSILIGIKDGNIEVASQVLQKVAKTNWPELVVIKKSLDHEKNRLVNRINEGAFNSTLNTADEQIQLAAVNETGLAIKYIKNPSEQVQLAAIKQDAYAIAYIKNPSEKVQLAAVNETGNAIYYIKNPSEKVQLAAVKQNGLAIKYIKNPSEQVQLAAVKQNRNAIYYIKNPREQVQLAAFKKDVNTIYHIKNPSIAVLNQFKPEIIKSILISIKNLNISLADELLQKVAKTNWPELDIIKKSLDYEKKK